jgi:hypothetical protein
MGGKPSNSMQSDRPESGGADKDMAREKSGLLDRDKVRFATDEAEKRAQTPHEGVEEPSFSVGNPRNPEK